MRTKVIIQEKKVLSNLINWKNQYNEREFINFNKFNDSVKYFFKKSSSNLKYAYAFKYPDGEKAIVYINKGVVILLIKTKSISKKAVLKSLSQICNTIQSGNPKIMELIAQKITG